MKTNLVNALSAFSGGLAVILGALAAHALHDTLESAGHLESWNTAALYHLTHSILALVVAMAGYRKIAWSLLLGILLFSGSIYLLCLVEGVSWLGPITPLGGLLLIGAWFALGVTFCQKRKS
ncbi:MAG: DUF423 domain-containing protein [Verrucomicrobiota bacterium JB023]|nr:DUF423 domain-containing protein [Verrucomicrobiota bacterium JB023]